jgi:hypothetical protein
MIFKQQNKPSPLKTAAAHLAVLGFALVSIGAAAPQVKATKPGLEYVAPEDVGWSSEKLAEAKAFAEKINSAAVMVLRDNKVFISWGNVATKYKVHSIRKPFLGALYGIYWGRGKINLDATLEELGIDDISPSLTKEEKMATVSGLLKSRSGVYHEAAAETEAMAASRPERGSHPHNTFWYYNNWDFNALGTIFEKVTGARIFEAFKKEIADPIGMEDFSLDDCQYSYEREKSEHPAYNFRMSARDLERQADHSGEMDRDEHPGLLGRGRADGHGLRALVEHRSGRVARFEDDIRRDGRLLPHGRRHPHPGRPARAQDGLYLPLRYGRGIPGPGRRDHPARLDDHERPAFAGRWGTQYQFPQIARASP